MLDNRYLYISLCLIVSYRYYPSHYIYIYVLDTIGVYIRYIQILCVGNVWDLGRTDGAKLYFCIDFLAAGEMLLHNVTQMWNSRDADCLFSGEKILKQDFEIQQRNATAFNCFT